MEPVAVYRLADVTVDHEPSHPDEVVAGEPTTGAVTVTTLDGLGVEIGVWEMSTGAVRDVEAEEAFLVLSGRATIETGASSVTVQRGDVVRLAEGTKTVWTVTEPLRKLYITGGPS
ncbi:cupin domain-containing protein [Actinoplanes oblitus]|uniref:Cupin domain-containing protein n=1 Tax=Actinoplanes oblitus TaxID=3040509 RepID=A0ABY8WSJ5_9ACTN|nr:cupin domain-containing protein [Actinoplanes oblitus]WIM98775.1 cupin domain-containing protein [Actinoplanes oblitus]